MKIGVLGIDLANFFGRPLRHEYYFATHTVTRMFQAQRLTIDRCNTVSVPNQFAGDSPTRRGCAAWLRHRTIE